MIKLSNLAMIVERPTGFGFRPTATSFHGINALNFLRIVHASKLDFKCTVEFFNSENSSTPNCFNAANSRNFHGFRATEFTKLLNEDGLAFDTVVGIGDLGIYSFIYHPLMPNISLTQSGYFPYLPECRFLKAVQTTLTIPKELYEIEIPDIIE